LTYLKESFKEIFKHINASIIMIFITLFSVFFLSLFYNFYYNIDSFQTSLKENFKVIIYPKENASIDNVLKEFKKNKKIKNFKKIDREVLKDKINKDFLNKNFEISKEIIPLIYEVKVNYENIKNTKKDLLSLNEIDDVFISDNNFKGFSDFFMFLKFLLLAFSFLILVLCFILNMYSNRIFILEKKKEINIMTIFGAKSIRILMPNVLLVISINIFSFALALIMYFSFIEAIKDVMINVFGAWSSVDLLHIFLILFVVLTLNIFSSFLAYRKV
jgi:cell division protein FtsX